MDNGAVDIIFAGVGGQGSVLVSHLLADAAIASGYNVKLTETFGAAMRGGSVHAIVRVGEVWSPLPGKGKGHVVVGLEPLEALRLSVDFISDNSWIILNRVPWVPVDVSVGRVAYPEFNDIRKACKRMTDHIITLDATQEAEKLGNTRMMNIVMLGALMTLPFLDIDDQILFDQMEIRWNSKIAELNTHAYQKGKEIALKQIGTLP